MLQSKQDLQQVEKQLQALMKWVKGKTVIRAIGINCKFSKKMKNTWIIAAAAIALAACSETDEPVNPTIPTESKGYTQVSASLPETRTFLQGKTIKWSSNDEIVLWSDESERAKTYRLSGGAGTSQGTFTVKNDTEGLRGNEFFAVYPGSAVVNGDVATINMPNLQQLQKMDGANIFSFKDNINPMAAKGTPEAETLTIKLDNFQSLCAVLDIAIVPDADLHVTSIEIFSRGAQPLCGNATISWDASGNPTLNVSEANNTLTLGLSDDAVAPANEETHFYAVVPAGTYPNMQITLYSKEVAGGFDPTILKRRTVSMTLGQNKIMNVGAIFNIKTKAPETYAVGDIYPKTGTPQGVVFQVAADGLSGKMVALEDCKVNGKEESYDPEDGNPVLYWWNYQWGTYDTVTTIDDGLANSNQITGSAAVEACKALGKDWYLPAEAEFTSFINASETFKQEAFKALNGDNYWTSTIANKRSGKFSTQNVAYYTQVAEDGVNKILYSPVTKITTTLPDGASVRAIAHFVSE